MADESKGMVLVILGIVAVLAIVGLILLFSRAGATGRAFAPEPFEGGIFADTDRIYEGTAANAAQYICIQNREGKVYGEFQKPQFAYDERSKTWWEEHGFICGEI